MTAAAAQDDGERRKRRRRRIAAAGAIVAAAIAIPAGAFGMRFGYEHAHYQVDSEHEGFEVRRYAPRVVAEVSVEGLDPDRASSDGFRILAGYIFGGNLPGESIAMTTPVDRRASGEGERIAMTTPVDRRQASNAADRWTVSFTMPSKYTLADLPQPNDARVELRELDARRYAAVRFRGSPSEDEVRERSEELRRAADKAGLELADEPFSYARYDPPWTPSFLRRNEILLPLGG